MAVTPVTPVTPSSSAARSASSSFHLPTIVALGLLTAGALVRFPGALSSGGRLTKGKFLYPAAVRGETEEAKTRSRMEE
jgi:hypothetical protein